MELLHIVAGKLAFNYRQSFSEITKELAMIRNGVFFCLCSGYISTLWESQTQDSDCWPFLQEEDINTVYSAVAPIRLYDEKLIVKF